VGQEYIRQITVLGSVPSMGPVILYDDFESLLKFTMNGGTGDSTFALDAAVAYNGDHSLHMKTRATAAAENDWIECQRLSFQRPGRRYSFEVTWNYSTVLANKEILFQLFIADGAMAHACTLKYLPNSSKWQYLNSAGAYSDVPGGSQLLYAGGWHRLMFSLNEDSGKMIKVVSDGLEIDLSDLSYYQNAAVTGVYASAMVRAIAHTSPPAEVWIDEVLLMEI
jgi:hypothetical protein